MSSYVKKLVANQREERLHPKPDFLYYTTKSVFGIQWWTYLWLIGARGRGKSYAAADTFLNFIRRYKPENVKVYWFRLSDLSVESMLENKAKKAIDAKLVRKYGLDITRKGNTVYSHGKELVTFYPLVSAAKKGKGIAEYDSDFLNNRPLDPRTGKPIKRFIFIILDEFMMAEGLEKKGVGNPVEQLKIYLENILRDQERLDYPAVRFIGCANAVSECSDFLAQMCGYIPEKTGRFKLKRKHTIIDNIESSEAYLKKRKKSYTADVMDYDNDSNYTNVIKRDLETLAPKGTRLIKPTAVIKFSKDPAHWFTVWNGKIIKKYTGQSCKTVCAMKRYLDSYYDDTIAKSVIERYDARNWQYYDLISQATFAAELKLIKAK